VAAAADKGAFILNNHYGNGFGTGTLAYLMHELQNAKSKQTTN